MESFTSEQLYQHIIEDEGGQSCDFLERILEPGSGVLHISDPSTISQGDMERYGPGLVYQFKVHEDFEIPGCLSYLDKPMTYRDQRHSMVLIGIRMEGKQKIFLLQNWWRKKQFVEVSAEYLSACSASVAFVKTPQTKVPTRFKVKYAAFAESSYLDKPETYSPERAAKL